MVGSASLDKLDKYLRAIWLECCGHLSKFTIGGWGGMDVGKARKANAIFEPGPVLRHLYDFGTTTETVIKVVGYREGKTTTKHPVALLARNRMLEVVCQECDQSAQWLCIECVYEEDEAAIFATITWKNTRMRVMANRCLCSTPRAPGCAAMMGRQSHRID